MRQSSWLRSARSLLVPSGTQNGHHPTRLRKRALAAPLSVERLEDRTVPSTFTVRNLADSGPGSLRQAVDKGLKEAATLKAPVFEPLRQRDDFRKLLAELEKKGKP